MDLTKKRAEELEAERTRQVANEEVSKRFITLATELNGWLEQTQGRLNNVGLGDVSLEEQVKVVSQLEEELAAQRPKLTELEECHQVREFVCLFYLTGLSSSFGSPFGVQLAVAWVSPPSSMWCARVC